MGLFVATTVGMIIWIVGWSLGYKGIDVFLITLAIVLTTASARIITPHLPGNRKD